MAYKYRFLEDVAVADVAFEASGDTPSELFAAAANAVIDTMVDASSVGSGWERVVERQDEDVATLLFDWLSEIVFLKDAEGVLFQTAYATVTKEGGVWLLYGKLTGEPIDSQRHELRSDVKAVTKHLYAVWQDGNRWKARVVLDI